MFKPLLRTLPSLSGNMKIICFLDNYENLEDHIFEANVRSARLSPISSQLFTKYINLSLLKSTYEWDVRNFYTKYSDYFYKTLFDVNKNDLNIYDEYGINKNRNTDFEYGLKRISYQKNGKQFAFFAPIYIESLEDVPDYFEIKIEITNANYKTFRTIRINVGKENKANFLGSYIKEYAKNIDDNVVYLNKDDYEGIYYGIDVSTGGLTKKHDYRLQSIFIKQNSILNFDNIIAKGFERNTLIMKQILPLCFYFSLNDILSDVEKTMFYDAELDISGKWIKDNKEVLLNDFDLNYTKLTPQIPILNTETGAMDLRIPGNYNIMNMGYPSMKEASFYKYSFSNKITSNFCRWRLKYSSDEEPYMTNMSAAFSFYQGSKTKYGQFPNLYETLVGIVSTKPLNLFLPLNGAEAKYPISTIEKYNKIRANFGSEWFEPFIDIDDALSRCKDVRDNKVYFDGILYNLSNIYDSITSTLRIDKFGVFIRPKFHFITDEMIRDGKIVYSDYTIIKENSKYLTNKSPNCHVNDDVLTDKNPRLFSNLTTNIKQDLLEVNNIFVRNEEDDGDFICLSDYGIDMYKANSFARLEDLESRLEEDLYSYIYRNSTNGFEILPIYRLSNVLDKSNTLSAYYSYTTKLYISDGVNSTAKLPVEEDIQFSKVDKYALNDKSFYREGTFIDKEVAKNLIKEAYIGKVAQMYPGATSTSASQYINEYSDKVIRNSIDAVSSYTFNPVLMNNGGEVYAAKVFKSDYSLSPRFFGDEIKYADDVCYTYMFDNDFIYVDPYNLNNIISHYNTTWLKNDEALSYYCLPTFEKDPLIFNMNTITDKDDEWTYVDYDDEPDEDGTVILNPGVPPKKAQSSEIVGYLAERFFKKVIVSITTDITNYYLGFEITSRFSFPEIYFGKNKKLTLVTSSIPPQTSKKAIEDIYESADKVKINGKRYNTYLLDAVLKFLNGTAETPDYLDEPVKQLKQYMFAELNLHKSVFKSPSSFIMMDYLNTKTFNVKFLNKHHIGYYLKKLYLTDPSLSEYNSIDGFSYINNIFIRKRMFDENLCMKDIFISLRDLISFGELTEEQSIEFLLENIEYDESSNLFYFNNLIEKNGKIYKINSTEEIKSKMFIGNINDLYNENGEFDSSKLKFELVFSKQMLRVDDNIWRLINLEEKYAAPYKDLYIYEFEKEHEYNKNLFISYNIVEPETSNVGTLESVPGCLKPMFNLVRIEAKEESQIYCEYSLNNITKSHIEDDLIFDRFEEHVYDKSRYFYRHNCNNKICMYDLSTMNRNVPIDIAGEKYVFRSVYPEETSYKYFHDTFDLFRKNEIEFANYAYTYTYNVTLDEILKTRNELIEIKGSYNTVAFRENFEDIYEIFRENGIDEDGNYIYGEYHHEDHNPSLAYSYSVTLSYIPGSKPLFKMTSYTYVPVEYYEAEIGDKLGFTYYDDLKLYDKFNISTYEYNGTTYGFYLIDANINNTINSLKVISEDGDKLKYVSYINSVQLSENSEDDIKHIYKQLTPFVKNNPLRYFMTNCSMLMKPSVLSIPLNYHPVEVNENGMSYYDIIFDKEKFGNITLERYFDSITPIIKEQGVVNTYNLKYKDVKKSFKPTYLTNETIYKDEMSIVHYPGVRVYDMDDYSKYSLRKDIEYKHFNDNRMINLKENMNYIYDDYMTFAELQVAQSHTRVYEVFRELMMKHMYSMLDEKMIEWAFNKYSIEFGYQGVKLDPTQTEKLYKLEIYFKLY